MTRLQLTQEVEINISGVGTPFQAILKSNKT